MASSEGETSVVLKEEEEDEGDEAHRHNREVISYSRSFDAKPRTARLHAEGLPCSEKRKKESGGGGGRKGMRRDERREQPRIGKDMPEREVETKEEEDGEEDAH